MRKAKILATLGPSSSEQSVIEIMLHVGVNAVRINMSHGAQDEHAATIAKARAAALATDLPLSILVDLSGPKIRTRSLENGNIVLWRCIAGPTRRHVENRLGAHPRDRRTADVLEPQRQRATLIEYPLLFSRE